MAMDFKKLFLIFILGILSSVVPGCPWHQKSKNHEAPGMLPMANLIDGRKQELQPDVQFSRITAVTDIPEPKVKSAKSKRSLVFRFPKRNLNSFRNVRSFKKFRAIKPLAKESSHPLEKTQTPANNEGNNNKTITMELSGGLNNDKKSSTHISEIENSLSGNTTPYPQTMAKMQSIKAESSTVTSKTTSIEPKSAKEVPHIEYDATPAIDVKKILETSEKQTTVFRPFSRRFENFQTRNAASFTFSKKAKIPVKKKKVKKENLTSKLLKLLSKTTITLSTTMLPYISKSEPQIQATSVSTTPTAEVITSNGKVSVGNNMPASEHHIKKHRTLKIISKLNFLQQQLKNINSTSTHDKSDQVLEVSSLKRKKNGRDNAKGLLRQKNLLSKSNDVETLQSIMTSIGKAIKMVNSKSSLSKDTMKLLRKKVANLKSRIAIRNGLIPSLSLSNMNESFQKSADGTAKIEAKGKLKISININKIGSNVTRSEREPTVLETSHKEEKQNKSVNSTMSVKTGKQNISLPDSGLHNINSSKKDFEPRIEFRNKILTNPKVPNVQDNLLEWRPIGGINPDIHLLKKNPDKIKMSKFYENPIKISKIRKTNFPRKQKRRRPPKVKDGFGIRNKGVKPSKRRNAKLPEPPKLSSKTISSDWRLSIDKNSNIPEPPQNVIFDKNLKIPDPPQDITFNSQRQSLNKFSRNNQPKSSKSNSDFVGYQVDPMNKRPTYSDWINLKPGFRTKDPAEIRFEFAPVPSETVGKSKGNSPLDSSIPLPPPDNGFQFTTPTSINANKVFNIQNPTPSDVNNRNLPPKKQNQRIQMQPERQLNEQIFQNNNIGGRRWSKPDQRLQTQLESSFNTRSRLPDAKRLDWKKNYFDPAPRSMGGPTTSLNGWGINENKRNKKNKRVPWNRKSVIQDKFMNDQVLQSKIQFYDNSQSANSMRNHEGRYKPYSRPSMAVNKREMLQRREMGPMSQGGNTLYSRNPYWRTPGPFQAQRFQTWWGTTPPVLMNRQRYMNPFVNNFGMPFGMRNYNPAYPQGQPAWQQQKVESTTSKYEVARDILDTFWQNRQGETNFDKSSGKGNFQQRFVPIKPSPLDNSPPKMKRMWKAKKVGGELVHEYAKIFPYMELVYIFSSYKSAILIDYHHNKMAIKFKMPSSISPFGEICFIKSAPYTFTKAESEIRQRETTKTLDVAEGGVLYAELSGKIKRGQVNKMAGPEIYDFCNVAISKGHIFKLVSEPMSDVGSTNFHVSGLLSGQTKGPVSTLTITVDNAIDLKARL